ncbi:dTDP-4-dehydrorhamnose reductase [Gammaproteobacteria bacterium]|nr:dTDP-4-dehydrorhamnose reductase [Gammaproteobacteria bacterium]
MKVLILGSGGQLGQSFLNSFRNSNIDIVGLSRKDMDITLSENLKSVILKLSPDFVINTSAYTNVDESENNKKIANDINNIAVSNIANICCMANATLIHFSTDYIFNGELEVPYKENDIPDPQGIYGLTKLNGEKAIIASGCNYIIIRTSWVFSEHGKNFLKTMLRVSSEKKLNVVCDQFGCPTYAPDIADGVIEILPKIYKKNINQIYHYTGKNVCSWAEFAEKIFEIAYKKQKIKNKPSVVKITSDNYKTLAKRPKFSVLDCSKVTDHFDLKLSDWKTGIDKSLRAL